MSRSPNVRIRRARPDEAESLTALAMRSKRHWGYDDAFMARVASMLGVEEEGLRRWPAFVAETDAGVVGFYRLEAVDGEPHMTDLWVDPAHIGAGLGRMLWEHAIGRARGAGWTHLTIAADPNAEPFYAHCGARRVGEIDGGAGRMIPLFRYELT